MSGPREAEWVWALVVVCLLPLPWRAQRVEWVPVVIVRCHSAGMYGGCAQQSVRIRPRWTLELVRLHGTYSGR